MTVVDGGEIVSDVEDWEAEGLRDSRAAPGQRMACQASPIGPGYVRVRKPGVRLAQTGT
jgi:ferredoxin